MLPRRRAPAWTLAATEEGVIESIDTERLGLAIVDLGGGRKELGDRIDHSVGLEILVRLGDRVVRGQPLMTIFAPSAARDRRAAAIEDAAYSSEQIRPRSSH